MSSTLAPDSVSPNNPITRDAVISTFADLGIRPKEEDVATHTSLLTGIWELWDKVDKMEDYVPSVDEERFPRVNVHFPTEGENKWKAWGWKATVQDVKQNGGLLAGKTVCLKDNITLKGVPCLLGTEIFSDWTPNTDATVVTRVLEAGAIVVGKAVCEDMSLWGVSVSSKTGRMDNVYAEGYSAGGSSSGTGVLIGRGEVDFGIGGDQGGSIRIPSTKAGIVGLKPTFGLVPYTGIASLEATLDHCGPMTRTVLDNALLLEVLAGADGIDDRQAAGCPFPGAVPIYSDLAKGGVKGLKIRIISESLTQPLHDPQVSQHIVKAAEELRSLGAEVEEVSIPMHLDAPTIWAVIGRLSACATMLGKSYGRKGLCLNDLTDKMLPLTQEKFDKMFISSSNTIKDGTWGAKNLPPALFGKATNLVRKLKDSYLASLSKYDVLVTPTLVYLPQKLSPVGATNVELMQNSAGISLNTSAFNLTGLPALTFPVGFLPNSEGVKLPVGMQVIGKAYDEATLYRVAYAWEQSYNWKEYV